MSTLLHSRLLAAAVAVLSISACAAASAFAAKPGGDNERPSAPVLTATPGDGEIALSWTAATDNVAVSAYEVRRDGATIASLPATTLSYLDTGRTPGVQHSYRVLAFDAAGNWRSSSVVGAAATGTATPPPPPPPQPPPPACTTPAPFPSPLQASGRVLVDANDCAVPKLRGFNMHVGPGFTWAQSHFDAIAAAGGRLNRAVLHWDQFEPAKGAVDATAIANLDLHVQRARAAGMYTLLELHLNVGRLPAWAEKSTAQGRDETEKYFLYGGTLTRFLAARYGDPASPRHTPAVIGFGLNEPPLGDWVRNGNGSIPWLEDVQRRMISWFRVDGRAAGWIGFVAYGYASATPIYDDAWQNAGAADASPDAYDAVGGNVVIDLHDYSAGCTNNDPDCDGRQWNGMIWPTHQGGALLGTESGYARSTVRQSQLRAYVRPYKTFAAQADLPLMIGEWAWPDGATGELDWIADKRPVWADAGAVIEIQWNYDIDAANSIWAARPGGTWRPSISVWLVAP